MATLKIVPENILPTAMEGPRNFERMTVPQLKEILTERGIPCHGKRKRELESLAVKAAEMYKVIKPFFDVGYLEQRKLK